MTGLSQTAESVRSTAERMETSSRAASAAREAGILAQGHEAERQQLGELEQALAEEQPRFEMRRGAGGGWAVYDSASGRRATPAGLTQGQAEAAAAELRQQDIDVQRLEAELGAARR